MQFGSSVLEVVSSCKGSLHCTIFDLMPLRDVRAKWSAELSVSLLCNQVAQKPRYSDQFQASCSSESEHSSLGSSNTLAASWHMKLIAASVSRFYLTRIILQLVNST